MGKERTQHQSKGTFTLLANLRTQQDNGRLRLQFPQKCESKNIYTKKGEAFFYIRMPNNKYGRNDGISELASLQLPM